MRSEILEFVAVRLRNFPFGNVSIRVAITFTGVAIEARSVGGLFFGRRDKTVERDGDRPGGVAWS